MAWWPFRSRPLPSLPAQPPAALTAAAVPAQAPLAQFMRHSDKWQYDAWGYFDTVGEYNYGVRWRANMMSRVRLRAGRLVPGTDEPVLMDDGLPTEVMAVFGQGVGGQAEIMRRLTVQLSVPGECYLIGENQDGVETWSVRATEEVRAIGPNGPMANGVGGTRSGYQVTEEDNPMLGQRWRDLDPDSVPIRVWRPHDRFYHLADSASRSALGTLRELEMVNRHIVATYMSRLASAGVLILPEEMTFPVREEFADAEDSFVREWIEIAATAIKNPGTASSLVPMVIQVPAEFVGHIQHLDFTLKIDDKILDKRDQAIRRLATQIDVPSDVILGLQDMNHWNVWASDDQGLKVHIAPDAEVICAALTTSYLRPRLLASKMTPAEASQYVAWYDLSELTLRPDRSQNAQMAYDRMELSGDAYRREIGFDPSDAPTTDELEKIGLKALIQKVHGAAPAAFDVLIGKELLVPATQGPGAVAEIQGPVPEPGQPQPQDQAPAAPVTGPPAAGPPQAGSTPPAEKAAPPPGASAAVRSVQASTQHAVSFRLDGRWDLRHPHVCAEHQMSCPFTHAVTSAAPVAQPGMPGTYVCHLDAFGMLRIDGPAPYLDTSAMPSTLLMPGRARANGAAHA